MFNIESKIAIVAIFALLIGAIACEPAPEEPEITEPNDEPVVEEEEVDEHAEEMQRLQTEIEQMHQELTNEYAQLDQEYQQLDQADEIDPELFALVERMGAEYRDYTALYQQMHGEMEPAMDNPQAGEEMDEPAREDWDDPTAMFELENVYTMIEHHSELNTINEEMIDLNRDVDRDELADRHESLAEMHQELQGHYEEIRDMMEDIGVT